MKSLSIHGIDRETEIAIKARAKSESKSVNKIVKEIIEHALGLRGSKPAVDNRAEFADLSGIWTAEEADRFLGALSEFEVVEPGDWR